MWLHLAPADKQKFCETDTSLAGQNLLRVLWNHKSHIQGFVSDRSVTSIYIFAPFRCILLLSSFPRVDLESTARACGTVTKHKLIIPITVKFLGTEVPYTLGWPYTEGNWLYCDYFIWCISCTVVVLTCFVMCGWVYVGLFWQLCGCFGNMCTCIYCVLYCFYCVSIVSVMYILTCFVI